MNIDIIAPGRIKERYLRDAIDEYSKRLQRFCKLTIIEVADEKTPEHATPGEDELIKRKERERIAKHLKDGAYVIALAIDGQELSSERFAAKLEDLALHGESHIQFVIGGSLGLDPAILKYVKNDLSAPSGARDALRADLSRVQDQRPRALPQMRKAAPNAGCLLGARMRRAPIRLGGRNRNAWGRWLVLGAGDPREARTSASPRRSMDMGMNMGNHGNHGKESTTRVSQRTRVARAAVSALVACALCIGGAVMGGGTAGDGAAGVLGSMTVATAYADDTSCSTVSTPEQALACAQQAADAATAALQSAQQRLDQANAALAKAAQDLANAQAANDRAQQVLKDLQDAKTALDNAANSDEAKQAIAKAKSALADAASALSGLDPSSFDTTAAKAAISAAIAQAQAIAQQVAQQLRNAQTAQQIAQDAVNRAQADLNAAKSRKAAADKALADAKDALKKAGKAITDPTASPTDASSTGSQTASSTSAAASASRLPASAASGSAANSQPASSDSTYHGSSSPAGVGLASTGERVAVAVVAVLAAAGAALCAIAHSRRRGEEGEVATETAQSASSASSPSSASPASSMDTVAQTVQYDRPFED